MQRKFNDMLKENEQLRHELNDFRTARQRFDEFYSQLCKEQEKTKREIGEIIDQSTQAYEQRFVLRLQHL